MLIAIYTIFSACAVGHMNTLILQDSVHDVEIIAVLSARAAQLGSAGTRALHNVGGHHDTSD